MISYDEPWISGPDRRSRIRQVCRPVGTIGCVQRWREEEPGELIVERFTAERMKDAFSEPIDGDHAAFEEASERIVIYGVAH